MADFNQTILAGRLTANPELRYTQGGSPVAEYTLAVNRKYANKDDVLFIGCITFGKQAETVSRHLQKGSSVLLSGYLKQENWTTKAGEKRSAIKVITDTVSFLEKPQKAEKPAENATGHKNAQSYVPQFDTEDNINF